MYIYAGDEHIAAVTDKIDADRHRHLMLQISVSFGAEFDVTVEGKEIHCKGILIGSRTEHTFYSNQEKQIFFLIDNTSMLAKQIQEKFLKGQSCCILPEPIIAQLQALLHSCGPILDREQYLRMYGRFFELLQISTKLRPVMDERILELLSRIKNCREGSHSLEAMAKGLFLSQSRLSHLFKKETGMSLSSYLVLHKLEKAMFYIFANKNITEASMKAGFDSPSHFAAVCKKTLGMTARELDKDSVFLKVGTY
jgi:AraC-like DNA-binding protein